MSIRWAAAAGIVLGLAAVLLPAAGLVLDQQRDGDLADAREAAFEAERSLVAAVNVETGMRGYTITADPRFLEPYNQGRTDFDEGVSRVRALVGEDDIAALTAFETAYRRWLTEWAEVQVGLVQSGRQQAAVDATATAGGKQRFDAFREAARSLDASLQAAIEDAESSRDRQQIIALALDVGGGVALAAMAAVVLLIVRAREQAGRRERETAAGLRASEARLAAAVEDLTREQEVAATRGDVIATVSHEIRNPLTGLVLATQQLQRHAAGTRDNESIQLADDISASALRLTHMAQEMLDFARAEAGSLRVDRQDVSLATLVTAALDDAALGSSVSRQDVTLAIPADLVVHADPSRLRLVFRNLFENAFRYGHPPVRVTVEEVGRSIRVHVEDSGAGIRAGEEELIFQRFKRGAGVQADGTGLGLYLSRSIMEAHGGSLRVGQSGLGGADFLVLIPPNE